MSRLTAGWMALLGFAAALVVAFWPLSVDVRSEARTGLASACRTARLCDKSSGTTATRPATWKPDCGSVLVGGNDRSDRACTTARKDRLPLLVTPLVIGVLATGVIPALPRRARGRAARVR